MPSTENDRRNLNRVDIANPSVPDHPRTDQEGMRRVQMADPVGHAPDLMEESELPAAEVSVGAGVETRNTDEGGELNESLHQRGFILPDRRLLENASPVDVSSVDQDNNRDF